MSAGPPALAPLRLALARACAWALLVAGWVGIGSLALQLASSTAAAFALVALWLLALGGAAALATRGDVGPGARTLALVAAAAAAVAGLLGAVRGGALPALLLALVGWAALTALASGVVRTLRRAQSTAPKPPVGAAAIGALAAGIALGDPADLPAIAVRLAAFVGAVTLVLALLQRPLAGRPRGAGCRAGLFDCSLPAWPAGAWRDPQHWPTLLAGLAMLPMMAALPLMAAWCRVESLAPQALVLLHLAAMFGPALLVRRSIGGWSERTLAVACTLLLAGGAGVLAWAPAPLDLLGLAVLHGAAWGLAWAGQLWAPARRGRAGASPLRAAAGYALLTLAFGFVVGHAGAAGVAATHAALALAAVAAWPLLALSRPPAGKTGAVDGRPAKP